MTCYIRDIREVYPINISRLCEKCGISRTAFYNIENGKTDPKISTAIKIMREINTQLRYTSYGSFTLEDLWSNF